MEYFAHIQELIASNPVLTGIFGASFLGGILVWARNLPRRFWAFILYHFTITLEVNNSDDAFPWVLLWISKTSYAKKARSLSITTHASISQDGNTPYDGDDNDYYSKRQEVIAVPGNGWSFTFVGWRPYFFSRHREQNSTGSTNFTKPFETIRFTTIGRSQKSADKLVSLIRASVEEKIKGKTKVMVPSGGLSYHGNWHVFASLIRRGKDSVILRDGIMDKIIDDVNKFLESKELYEQYGVPYHRGYLFYGKPGNGKSSVATVIAGEIGYSICVMSLSSVKNDDTLRNLFSSTPQESIILMEDVDAAFDERENKEGITFSSLLNVIDGVGAKHGQIVIMTTNHIEKLDPALIRNGRVDMKVEFENACSETARTMFNRFNPKASGDEIESFVSEMTDKPMANLQERLMANVI